MINRGSSGSPAEIVEEKWCAKDAGGAEGQGSRAGLPVPPALMLPTSKKHLGTYWTQICPLPLAHL